MGKQQKAYEDIKPGDMVFNIDDYREGKVIAKGTFQELEGLYNTTNNWEDFNIDLGMSHDNNEFLAVTQDPCESLEQFTNLIFMYDGHTAIVYEDDSEPELHPVPEGLEYLLEIGGYETNWKAEVEITYTKEAGGITIYYDADHNEYLASQLRPCVFDIELMDDSDLQPAAFSIQMSTSLSDTKEMVDTYFEQFTDITPEQKKDLARKYKLYLLDHYLDLVKEAYHTLLKTGK
jgi:hypothetical protein